MAGRPVGPDAPVNVGIELSSTFAAAEVQRYGRDDNATWEAFETVLGALEGGQALAFGSGMGAIAAVLETVPVGGTVVVPAGAYNGTKRWCTDAAARGRLAARWVDVCDTAAVLAAAADADLVWLESPTNPCLDVADLVAICGSCSCPVVVDNTLATPLLQRPLALGADIVVHSVTKWLAGHSDVVMGAAVVSSDPLLESLRTRRSLGGAVPGPTEAWLALRGVRTLPARLARAEATAGELAVRLSDHPAVSRVRYPGLPSDPGYALASKQMDGPGAMVSFEMRGGAAAADAVCVGVRLLVPATSLGGVETLIERRGKYANEEATPPALLRMSVGQEDVEDLWEDLSQALG